MPTLEDLAKEQTANGQNPWLTDPAKPLPIDTATPINDPIPGGQVASPMPDQTGTGFLGVTKAPAINIGNAIDAASVHPGIVPPAPPPEPKQGEVGTKDEKGKTYGPVSQGGYQAPEATKVPGATSVGGKTTPSNEMEYATGHEGINAQKEANIGFQQDQEERLGKIRETSAGIVADMQTNLAIRKQHDADVETKHQIEVNDAANKWTIERQQRVDDIVKQAQQTGPEAYWKKKGTAGNILAAIAIGFGAFGASFPHNQNHTNYALDIINKGVDQDIEAQKDHIRAQWDGLTRDTDMHKDAMTRQMYLDQKMRDLRYEGYGAAQDMIQQQLTRTSGQEAQIQGQKMWAALEEKKLEIKDDTQKTMMIAKNMDRQRAQAAAAAAVAKSPESMYMKYVQKAEDENSQHPDKPVGIKPYTQWHKEDYSGAGAVAGSPTNSGSKALEDSLARLDMGWKTAIKNTGIGTAIGGAITPGGTAAQDSVNQYNAQGAAILKSVESRLPQNEAERVFNQNYGIHPWLSEKQNNARREAFRNHVREVVGVKPKAGTDTGAPVEGAEPME